MGSESIAHSAFGLVGYWLGGHSGSRNNCEILLDSVAEYLLSPYKGIQSSGFHAVESRFQALDFSLCQWNLDSGFQSLEGFRISWTLFRIPPAKISPIPESGFPYTGEFTTFALFIIFCWTFPY